MTVLRPTSSRSRLEREDGSSAPQNTEPIFLVLLIESKPAGQADHASFDPLSREPLSSIDSDVDFTSGADDSEVFILLLNGDVTATGGLFDGRSFQVGQVLARKRENGGG